MCFVILKWQLLLSKEGDFSGKSLNVWDSGNAMREIRGRARILALFISLFDEQFCSDRKDFGVLFVFRVGLC